MYKKTITYVDYDGTERTEDFYFNLTKAEITDMELSTTGGLEAMIEKMISTKDLPALAKLFRELINKTYGEKSADGRRFMKEDEKGRPLWKNFAETEAYSELYMMLATDSKEAANFINGVAPVDISDKFKVGPDNKIEILDKDLAAKMQ